MFLHCHNSLHGLVWAGRKEVVLAVAPDKEPDLLNGAPFWNYAPSLFWCLALNLQQGISTVFLWFTKCINACRTLCQKGIFKYFRIQISFIYLVLTGNQYGDRTSALWLPLASYFTQVLPSSVSTCWMLENIHTKELLKD